MKQDIPGGGPQGGLLKVILFDLQVNGAEAPCPLPITLAPLYKGPDPDPKYAGPAQPCHLEDRKLKKKYADNFSLLEAINLIPSSPMQICMSSQVFPSLLTDLSSITNLKISSNLPIGTL